MVTKQKVPSPLDAITTGIGAFDNLADAIANPDPSQPLRDAVGQSGRAFCNFIGALPTAAQTLLGPGVAVGSLMCKPYWDKNSFDPPRSAPDFTGGQCPISYRPSGTYFNDNANAGPVGLRTWRLNVSVTGPLVGFAPSGAPVGTQWAMVSATNGGLPFGTATDLGNNKPVFGGNQQSGTANMWSKVRPVITATAPSGGADTCGDPPGGLRPGERPPPTPPAFPPGQEPGVDPDGQPFFFVPPAPSPFPDTDPIDVPPIEPLPPGGGGGSPPGPAEPGAPGEGTEPEGEAPGGKEIYALVVTFLTTPPFAREIEPGLFVSPCRVFLGTSFGLDLDEAGRAMRSGQAVFAEADGLTKWRVSASVGFTVRVTPYYREKAS